MPEDDNEKTEDQPQEKLDAKKDQQAIDSKELKKTAAPGAAPKEPPKREPKNVTITDMELEQFKKEASEFKDKYLRALAESENARKRLQKEKQELIQYAIQNVMVDFLNPIDHMENALKYTEKTSDEVKHWVLGFQMILTQFKDVLARNGVTPFISEGQSFDPHYHEAIETVATEECPPGIVLEETLRGYRMNDRTIRPARVKVSKAPPVSKQNEENKTEQKTNG
jgi:molecular chaperone GrpE